MRFFLIILLCLLAQTALAEPPQELLENLDRLWRQSERQAKSGNHQKAISSLKEALALQPYPAKLSDLAGEFHHQLAIYYAVKEQPDKVLSSLRLAVTNGFTDFERTERTPQFSKYRSDSVFLSSIAEMKKQSRRKRIFDITGWNNADLDYPGEHPFEGDETLSRLRDHYKLQEVVRDGKTEWEQQLRLLNWVHNRWAHSGLQEPSKREAWTILQEVDEGKRFRCVEYSVVIAETAQSLGWPARTMWLRDDNASYGVGKGHVVTELWNNDMKQWVLIDGQNNAYWTFDGKPLNASEIRQLGVDKVQFVTQSSNWQNPPASQDDWDDYFTHLKATVDRSGQPTSFVAASESYEPLFQGTPAPNKQTSDARRFYPNMNGVHFDVQSNENRDSLLLTLSHSAPWFSHYEIRAGADSWEHRESEFVWKLKPGANKLQVRTVNQRRVVGPESVLEVVFYPVE